MGEKHDDHGSWTYHLKSFLTDLREILLASVSYAKTSAFFPDDIQLAISFLQRVTCSHRTVSSQLRGIIMPEPHQRWFWHPALYITALKTETFQQTTPSICKVAVFSTKHIHNAPPNFIRLPSVLIAGGRLQLLQTRLQLGQPLLSQVDRSNAEAEKGRCLAQRGVTRNLFKKTMPATHFHPSSYVAIYTYMLSSRTCAICDASCPCPTCPWNFPGCTKLSA